MARKHGGRGKGGTDRGHGWALGLTPANVKVLATSPPLGYPTSFEPKSVPLPFLHPFSRPLPKPGSPSPMHHHCSALSQRHGDINPSQDLLLSSLWSLLSNQEAISKMHTSHVTPQSKGLSILSVGILSKCSNTAVTAHGDLWDYFCQPNSQSSLKTPGPSPALLFQILPSVGERRSPFHRQGRARQ